MTQEKFTTAPASLACSYMIRGQAADARRMVDGMSGTQRATFNQQLADLQELVWDADEAAAR